MLSNYKNHFLLVNLSPQFSHKFLRSEVGVPLQHRQCLVTTDYANLNGVQSFLKQAGDRFMAEIVKPQVL